jgi:hypothetical protein
MRATISFFVTSLLLTLLVFDYQAIGANVLLSASSSQHTLLLKQKKSYKPPTYRGSGRRGEGGMI